MNKSIMWLCTALLLCQLASAQAKTVLVDQSHGQPFIIEREGALDLSTFASVLRENHQLSISDGKITSSVLSKVDVLITSGAFVKYDQAELAAINRFINDGGSLCVMIHIAPVYGPLLSSIGVSVSSAVIHETQNTIAKKSSDFTVSHLVDHPLFADLQFFSLFGGWALKSNEKSGAIIASTTPGARLDINRNRMPDRNDPVAQWGVIVQGKIGKGRYVVFADDAMFQNRFLTKENRQLAKNLSAWLM